MPSMRARRIQYLINQGFFKGEAIELSRTSRSGMRTPYFQAMVKSRRRLFDNAKRYKWSDTEYREYIKKQYVDKGFIREDKLGRKKIDVWAMVRDFEDRSHRRGEEYTSPWRKRMTHKNIAKKENKRVTRKDMLRSLIRNVEQKMARTKDVEEYQVLQERRDRLQKQYEAMA